MGDQRLAPAALSPGRDPVPTVQETGWAPRTSLDGCGKSRPYGVRAPDCPARSESLYRIRYPGRLIILIHFYIMLIERIIERSLYLSICLFRFMN
jgi:hypothetical protein